MVIMVRSPDQGHLCQVTTSNNLNLVQEKSYLSKKTNDGLATVDDNGFDNDVEFISYGEHC